MAASWGEWCCHGDTGLVAHGMSHIFRHIKAGDGEPELLIEFASALIVVGHSQFDLLNAERLQLLLQRHHSLLAKALTALSFCYIQVIDKCRVIGTMDGVP